MKYSSSVLFIADTSHWSVLAGELVDKIFNDVQIVLWDYGTTKPSGITNWSGDWIISFKSDLILEENILTRAKKGAINIHPATPLYRGIGGYHYAIENCDKEYGVTCHHIVRDIDAGPIISVKRFPIIYGESPDILKHRAGAFCIEILGEVVSRIVRGMTHPISTEEWSNELHTRAKLEKFLRTKSVNFVNVPKSA